jgi:hypothetical protein
LLCEELTANLIPKQDLISVDFDFPDNQLEFELVVTYGGAERDVTQTAELSANIVKGIADKITHAYDGVNRLCFKW